MYANEHFFVQVFTLMLTSMVVTMYYAYYEPFAHPILLRIELFNEVTQIALAYALLCFSPANLFLEQESFAYDIGFFSIAGFNLVIHLGLLMISSLKSLFMKIKAKCKCFGKKTLKIGQKFMREEKGYSSNNNNNLVNVKTNTVKDVPMLVKPFDARVKDSDQ